MSDDVRDVLEAVKRHPGRRMVFTQSLTAVCSFGVAACALAVSPMVGVPFAMIGALYVWSAWDLRRTMRAIPIAGRAHAAIASGDRELAAKLLDVLEGERAGAQFRRIASTYRASLAMSAADPREAIIQSTKAISEPVGLLIRDAQKSVAVLATTQRALARAMLHEDDAALADADAANDETLATPLARAQAELARALVAANRDRKDEVRTILERAAPMMEDLNGRQRELAKRLARFAAPGKRTIYRHAAKPHEDEIASLLASPSQAKNEIAAPPAATAAPPPLAAKPPPNSVALRVILIWVALIVMFAAIWQVLTPSDPALPPTDPVAALMPLFAAFAAIIATLFYALVGLNLRRASTTRTARRAAVTKALAGDASAVATLEKLAKRSPEAALELAQAYERQAEFARALATCDQGITNAAATRVSRMTTHDLALPGLVAERALCFAALGKVDEASAVLASIPTTTYPFAPLARFRVGLAQALARGDRKGALEIARKRGDTLGIPRRDAFLVDLLEATEGRGASDEEWSRLHAELAADPALAKWIDHFLPSRTLERRVAEEEPLEEDSAEGAGEERVDA